MLAPRVMRGLVDECWITVRAQLVGVAATTLATRARQLFRSFRRHR